MYTIDYIFACLTRVAKTKNHEGGCTNREFQCTILVDLGSTHNFMDAKLARQSNLPVELSTKLQVIIADGGIMSTQNVFIFVQW